MRRIDSFDRDDPVEISVPSHQYLSHRARPESGESLVFRLALPGLAEGRVPGALGPCLLLVRENVQVASEILWRPNRKSLTKH